MNFRILIFAAFLLPVPSFAGDHQFINGAPVTIEPDKAYILVRTVPTKDGGLRGTAMYAPVLLRVLSPEALQEAQLFAEKKPDEWKDDVASNVVEPLADKPYAVKNGEEFLLTSLKPGTYILGGVAVTNWATVSAGLMVTSLCMGTVKFEVKPGMVTDLGTILVAHDDAPTTIPELANVVSGKPRGFGPVPQTVALRPAASASELPGTLKALPLVPADYRAVEAFANYIGAQISRLAPVAGVLDYDKDGHAVDLRGRPATP